MAKEIKTDERLDLFAATPPLEAKKSLFRFAVTEGIGFESKTREEERKSILLISKGLTSKRTQSERSM